MSNPPVFPLARRNHGSLKYRVWALLKRTHPEHTLLRNALSCILTLTMSKINDDSKEPSIRRGARSPFSANYQPSTETRNLGHVGAPLMLFVTAVILYLAFRSASFDDFDSYSFGLALDHYSLTLQQPHPPGFPIYITLGRILRFLIGDALTALTTLSALSGAASIVLVYLIGRIIDPNYPSTGLFAALMIAFLPVHWLTSEKALSDALGLAAILIPLWLWARWIQQASTTKPWVPALLSGLALGVRPQNALPFLLLAVYLVFHRRRAFHPFSILAFMLGVLLWLIPTALSIGDIVSGDVWSGRLWLSSLEHGLRRYVETILEHAAHVGRADAITGMSGSVFESLRLRWLALTRTLLESNLGVTFSGLTSTSDILILVSAGFLVVPGLINAGWHRGRIRWVGAWLLAIGLQILLVETLHRPRLLLPLLPPLALLVASGWAHWRLKTGLKMGVVLTTSLFLIRIGLPWAATLSHVPAPPAQATTYIAGRYPPDTTFVAAAGSYRAVQVELPQYRHAYLYEFDSEAVRRWLAEDTLNHVVILDRDQFPHEVVDTLSAGGRWVPVNDVLFARNRHIHTQHDQVRLQVLMPASSVPIETLAPGTDGCVDIGGQTDGRYLGTGWFRSEVIGGVKARWAGGITTSTVRLTLPSDRDYQLRVRGMAYPEGQTVSLHVDGRELDRAMMPNRWSVIDLSLPSEALEPEGFATLTLVHARALSPAEATPGSSSDTRVLTAAYDWICVSDP